MRINPINNNQTNFGAVYKVQANHNMIKHFDANVAQVAKNKGKSVVAFVEKAPFFAIKSINLLSNPIILSVHIKSQRLIICSSTECLLPSQTG